MLPEGDVVVISRDSRWLRRVGRRVVWRGWVGRWIIRMVFRVARRERVDVMGDCFLEVVELLVLELVVAVLLVVVGRESMGLA